MSYFRKILRFAIPYKRFAYLNIFFNILYALFITLSFVALIPVLKVIFNSNRVTTVKPDWNAVEGFGGLKDYSENYLNYFLFDSIEKYGDFKVLIFMVFIIIAIFLLKNLFNYLAMFYITFLRNGILKDLRNELYGKVILFPLEFYSEKTKGDTIARLSSDVNEVRNSVLSMLEMIVREP